jgi:hypothetical protein
MAHFDIKKPPKKVVFFQFFSQFVQQKAKALNKITLVAS